MNYEILQGDCRELLPTLAPASFAACITDPPYGMGKDFGNDSDGERRAVGLKPPLLL